MSDTPNSNQNVKIDITANADGVESGVSKANAELDKLSQGTSNLDNKYKAAVDSSEKVINVTQRTTQQFVTLGKEVISGDTGRIPGTLARIAVGFGPIGIAVGVVAGAVAAGVWAWMEWGDEAENAAKKASEAWKEAAKDREAAERGIHRTLAEQIRDLEYKRSGVTGQIEWALNKRAALPRDASYEQVMGFNSEVGNRRAELTAYDRQIADLKARQAEEAQRAADKDAREQTRDANKTQREQDKAARERGRDAEKAQHAVDQELYKYERLNQIASMADATDAERVSFKLAYDLQAMEKEHEQAKLIYGNKADLENEYQDARLVRTAMANAEIERMNKAHADKEEAERQRKIRSEMSIANFSELIRQKDFSSAMGMAERLSAGMATKHRAMFEINKASALASATITGYKAVTDAYAHGTSWGGPAGGVVEAAIAAAYVAAQLDAISSTSFGGGGGSPGAGGGGVPSQATSPGIPVTQTPAQQQPLQITIYNTGTFVDAQAFIDQTVIPQITDAVTNRDVLLIDPRSRQAQVLVAA